MHLAVILVAAAGVLMGAEPDAWDRALELFRETDYTGAAAILRKQPQDKDPVRAARSLELLGRCYLNNADYKPAVEVLEKAAQLDPSNSMAWTWLGRAWGRRAETSFALGAMGAANKSRAAFEKAVQLDLNNGEALDDLFNYYVDAPGFVGGGFEKAHKLVPLIAAIDPAQGRFSDARLAENRKEYATAEARLRDAVALSPRSAGRLVDLAAFLSRRGRFEESDKLFEQAAHVAPNMPRILFARAEALIHAHRNLDQARDLLRRYLSSKSLTPDDPPRPQAIKLLRKAEGG